MKLTPIDIKKQEFKTALRGYDRVEVETYLEYVAEEYERLLQNNQRLEKEVGVLKAELRHYKDVEKTLKQTLYEVQQTSQLSKKTSEKEAELIRREAEVQAKKMIEDARGEVSLLKRELADLKQQKDSLITRLRYLLSSQLELLEILETDDAQLDKLKNKTHQVFKGSKRAVPVQEKSAKKTAPAEKEPEINIQNDKTPAAPKPEKKQAKSSDENKSKKSADFFKDIFGDDLDDFLK
ncbi:DivIVA domain-containing protein [Calditrichota bacterium LG25]